MLNEVWADRGPIPACTLDKMLFCFDINRLANEHAALALQQWNDVSIRAHQIRSQCDSERMADQCVLLWQQTRHPEHDMTERPHLTPAGQLFDGFVEHTRRASLITFERNRYIVPASFTKTRLPARRNAAWRSLKITQNYRRSQQARRRRASVSTTTTSFGGTVERKSTCSVSCTTASRSACAPQKVWIERAHEHDASARSCRSSNRASVLRSRSNGPDRLLALRSSPGMPSNSSLIPVVGLLPSFPSF